MFNVHLASGSLLEIFGIPLFIDPQPQFVPSSYVIPIGRMYVSNFLFFLRIPSMLG